MAAALDETLGDALTGGVISAPPVQVRLSDRWQFFAGGHPLPNEASLAAAHASFALLRKADEEKALVIFLISGGGSAMLEWPRGRSSDASVTLAELQEANRALVSCGASITEINTVRRAFSAVKGGGLSAQAPCAAQITLIISDTAADEPHNVASGPTFTSMPESLDAVSIVNRYALASRLPASILRLIRETCGAPHSSAPDAGLRRSHVLLDNDSALAAAVAHARALNFTVEIASDVCEQPIEAGVNLLVSRLIELRRRAKLNNDGRSVCLISGGEFSCPVRGEGIGGRNTETALRGAIVLATSETRAALGGARVSLLSAGTDGIDGNSPAAGAISDEQTIERARALKLDARKFLAASDAYTFFAALDDAVMTGATGTNVRDLRLLLAK
jgi:hydroxypyruvate reductase